MPDLEPLFDRLTPWWWTLATQMGLLSPALGFDYQGNGVYTTRPDALQLLGGYSDFYDWVLDVVTDALFDKFEFEGPDGNSYALWVWKGDYLNLGAGAEIGFYVRGPDSPAAGVGLWKTVGNNNAPDMSVKLSGPAGEIASFDPIPDQAWVGVWASRTQNPTAESLTADYTVTFDTPEMFAAFRDRPISQGVEDRWRYDAFTKTATLSYRRKKRRES